MCADDDEGCRGEEDDEAFQGKSKPQLSLTQVQELTDVLHKQGDCVLIVDAGGGTVVSAPYTSGESFRMLTFLTSNRTLSLAESSLWSPSALSQLPGQHVRFILNDQYHIYKANGHKGGNYGSTCVEQAFLNKFLPYRLGAHYNRFTQGGHGQGSHVVLKGPILRLNQDFINNIKHRFEGPPETGEPLPEYYLPLNFDIPDNPAMGIDNANLRITW